MRTYISTIKAFDFYAKENCGKLFGGVFQPLPEYESRHNFKEAVHYFHEAVAESEEPEFHNYFTYVYPQPERWTIEEVSEFLDLCMKAFPVYFCYPTDECPKGRCLCYFWDTTQGMYLILAESNHAGIVEKIYVRVYDDLGIFFTDIVQLYRKVDDQRHRLIQRPHRNCCELMAELLVR